MVSRGKRKIVGQEDQVFSGLGIFEPDSAQWRTEALARIKDGQHDCLIADQAGSFVQLPGIAALNFEIGLGARDDETACIAESAQTFEIDVSASMACLRPTRSGAVKSFPVRQSLPPSPHAITRPRRVRRRT